MHALLRRGGLGLVGVRQHLGLLAAVGHLLPAGRHPLLDLVAESGGILRQRLHLLGHHAEAASHLARARGLERGVEGQEAGLVGDLAHARREPGDLVELPCRLGQLSHHGVGGLARGLDVPHEMLQHAPRLAGELREVQLAAPALQQRDQRPDQLLLRAGLLPQVAEAGAGRVQRVLEDGPQVCQVLAELGELPRHQRAVLVPHARRILEVMAHPGLRDRGGHQSVKSVTSGAAGAWCTIRSW